MRVAVPARTPEGLDSYVFSRPTYAPFFIIIDIDEGIKSVEVIRNPASGLVPYRGPSLSSWLKHLGVEAVLIVTACRDVEESLRSWGIKVFYVEGEKVRDVVNAFMEGVFGITPKEEVKDRRGLV